MLRLFALALALYTAVSLAVKEPGYMDACYYFTVAENLAKGNGLMEPFLWNYLDYPDRLPHPAFTYWMPLPSLLAWPFLKLLEKSYFVARLPFIILASCLPIISYRTAELLQEKTSEQGKAIPTLAAFLTIFSGFYVVYWPATDGFAPFALAGGLCLLLLGKLLEDGSPPLAFLAGVAAGLAHLTRADGFLLILPVVFLLARPQKRRLALCFLLAYLILISPWIARNVASLGVPLPTSGTKTVFLTNYDDLFSYGKELSWRSYSAWGAKAITMSKLKAAWLNLQTALAVFLMVFLALPFAIGFKRLCALDLLKPFWLYALALFLTMTLVFSYPGPRGSFFHSGGALLPFTTSVSAIGLKFLSDSWAKMRKIAPEALWRLNYAAAIFLAILVSLFVLYRALGPGQWNQRGEVYRQAEAWLRHNSSPEAIVMVGDPPCFYYYSRRPSIVIPNGDVETALRVAKRYGASFMLLEPDHPRPLDSLYLNPYASESLKPIAAFGKAILFRIEP